jgi:hypothetical protein
MRAALASCPPLTNYPLDFPARSGICAGETMGSGFLKFIGFVLIVAAIGLVGVRGLFTSGLRMFSEAPAPIVQMAENDER